MIPYRPDVRVPDFWLVRPEGIYNFLRDIPSAETVTFGRSAGGRDLQAVVFKPSSRSAEAKTLLVIGGTHGHEPGTNASCINLVNIFSTGRDLRGKSWPKLAALAQSLNVIVVPMLNPDGRERCPDSFTGFSREGTKIYERGLYRSGQLIGEKELVDGVNLDDVFILGGRYNDAGFLMNRPRSIEHTNSVETQQLLGFLDSHKPDSAIDLHACGWNFFIMTRTLPEGYREKLRGIHARVRAIFEPAGRQLKDIAGNNEPPNTGLVSNVRMIHHLYGSLAMVFEGRQGYADCLPFSNHDQIVDDYLTVVRETGLFGVAEGFKP